MYEQLLLAFALCIGTVALIMAPVVYIWCIKPNKSLKDVLREWFDESADDL